MDELKLFSVLSINIITAGEYLLHHPEKLIFILNPENLTTSLQSRQGEKNHQWFRETQSSQIQNCYKLFCTEFNKKKIIFCVFPWSHIMSTSTNPVIFIWCNLISTFRCLDFIRPFPWAGSPCDPRQRRDPMTKGDILL